MEGLDYAIDMFIGKYPNLRNSLLGIRSDDRYPVRVNERASEILSELEHAMQNVHNNNRSVFNTETEILVYIKSVGDLMSKATTAEVFSNITILKRLRDVDGIDDTIINDLLDGLKNKYRILNTIEVTTPEGAANAEMLRQTIERAEDYIMNAPPPRRTRRSPTRTRPTRTRPSRSVFSRYFSRRQGNPTSGGRKTKQKCKRVQKNRKESKNRSRNRKSK